MVTKVYAYPGISSGEIQIKCGRALIRVSFKDGYIDRKMSRPAIYSTGDKTMQQIIENSDLFNRRIFLHKVYGNPEETETVAEQETLAEAPAAEPAPAKESTSYPEVTTWEEAVRVLKSIPGVRVASLRTPASAKKVAAANAVVFPNYNFE